MTHIKNLCNKYTLPHTDFPNISKEYFVKAKNIFVINTKTLSGHGLQKKFTRSKHKKYTGCAKRPLQLWKLIRNIVHASLIAIHNMIKNISSKRTTFVSDHYRNVLLQLAEKVLPVPRLRLFSFIPLSYIYSPITSHR